MKEKSIIPVFAGFFFIFLGTSSFVKLFVNIDIPVGRIFWGFICCYIGYHLIMTRYHRRRHYRGMDSCNSFRNNGNATIMDSAIIDVDEASFAENNYFEYRTTMGNSMIDMTRIAPADGQEKTKHMICIDTYMGKTILKINKNCAFCIHSKGSLSHIKLPDGSTMNSGSRIFCSQPDTITPDLDIHALTVLGEFEIIAV